MLKIPQEENPNQRKRPNEEKSNVDIHEAIGKKSNEPVASEVPGYLDDLDSFSVPEPSNEKSGRSIPLDIPEPPSRSDEYVAPQPSNSVGSQSGFQGASTVSTDMVQEITESIVDEKWDELMDRVGDLRLWKEKINSDMTSIKQEILRTQNRFENLQKAVLGKVHDYNENIININNDMKALEKVFEKILQPMTENVKELSKITNKLKKK